MHSTIYNYFSEHHGVVNDKNKNNFENDYSLMSKNELKRQLQWNVSKADTYGTEVFVRFREVSALEKFELNSFQI